MRRREFISLLGGAAATWPLAARAQQLVPVIGFLRSSSLADPTRLVAAFRQGLKEAGCVDGQNIAIEYRSAEDHLDRLPALVADLIRRPAAVIVGNTPSALATKAATAAIPIVFVTGSDPIRTDLVASLNRPGGNVTGVANLHMQLAAKRLGCLHELLPRAARRAGLGDPNSGNAPSAVADRPSMA